jgi:type VI secretion system protein ImpC
VAKSSTEKFNAHNSPPRVQIEYDVELYGAAKKIQLPFVMGVLADLSGKGKPDEPLAAAADRKFLDIDLDNFDRRMKALRPRVAFAVPNTTTGEGSINVDLTFQTMDDFSPTTVARKVEALNQLLEVRKQLGNRMTSQKQLTPKTEEASESLEPAVRALAEQALSPTTLISGDTVTSIEASIGQLDGKLTEQLNLILHHPAFQKLESVWRGLHYLVSHTETDEMLKIRAMNISKAELRGTLTRHNGTTWDQSPLFKKVYEAAYGQFGGEPFGCLMGDYYFDQSSPDAEFLAAISKIAAAAHLPFIAGGSPPAMQMDTWQELANLADLDKVFTTPQHAAWRSLRESEEACYLILTMPRCLSRPPYGAKTNPVQEFDFEENTGVADASRYTWMNAAYAMAVNINRSFKLYGWCSRIQGIQSGGSVETLPTHCFPTDDGGVDMNCPTEIAISERRAAELAKNGLMALVHRKNSEAAEFIQSQSVQKPFEDDDPDSTASANRSARLPSLFACCRFVQYLKCIVRDKIGFFSQREDMQVGLQNWIMNYVDGDPAHSSETAKAQKPLAAADIQVDEVAGDPGYYTGTFFLRPHYQLEELTASLRLVSKLPSAKAS